MSSALLTLLVVVGLAYLWLTGAAVETFAELTPPTLNRLRDNWQHRLDELQDTDNVLKRPTIAGKPHINQLEPNHEWDDPIDRYEAPTDQPQSTVQPPTKDDTWRQDPKLQCLNPDSPVYSLIEQRQPYLFDQPEVVGVDVTKQPHYYDWRYPRKPISIKFATDPSGYCKRHPNTYPCYVIKSRHNLR